MEQHELLAALDEAADLAEMYGLHALRNAIGALAERYWFLQFATSEAGALIVNPRNMRAAPEVAVPTWIVEAAIQDSLTEPSRASGIAGDPGRQGPAKSGESTGEPVPEVA